jgi:glycerate 2-kinase
MNNTRISESSTASVEHARAIWDAAVAAVRPGILLRTAYADKKLGLAAAIARAPQIVVVGAGKAGAAMSAALEEILADSLDRVTVHVNVPAETVRALRSIRLHAARPAASNQPTAEGVAGASRILDLVGRAGPDDLCICLLSGGGSALLPAPADGITLEDKQQVTLALHACGATINEMNAVRKHLSRIKGGQLARAFAGKEIYSLIISDVVGDPLDVIASGPTAPDPTTFADALAVLEKYELTSAGQIPNLVLAHLKSGAAGDLAETPKTMAGNVHNCVIGNNALALSAAQKRAEELGYHVVNLGSDIQGETRIVADKMVRDALAMKSRGELLLPACILSGGETTVTLSQDHGLGGRNQEFVLAGLVALGEEGMRNITILSGGTDGEDGPTDAAGAVGTGETWGITRRLGLIPEQFLNRNDAYHFFDAIGGLVKTGLTETNVMDVRVILLH